MFLWEELIKVKLIGFDSMGTRGMATVLDVEGLKIFVDPGVSYAPRRYGLPPHPVEEEALQRHLDEIHREAEDSHILVISHYHRDHYMYRRGEEAYYRGKILIVKDPKNNINYSQRVRAYTLLNTMRVADLAKDVKVADNNTYVFEDVNISFSKPLPHGPRHTKLGYIVLTLIEYEGYRVLHASDSQGPIDEEALDFILGSNPDIVIISGPPTYFEGYKVKREDVAKGLSNLRKLVEGVKPGSTVIVDHHLLRDLDYRERIREVVEVGESRNVSILTAAEYMGVEIRQLEAMRRQLWMGMSRNQ